MSLTPDRPVTDAPDGRRSMAGSILWPLAVLLLIAVTAQAALAGGGAFGAAAWRMHVMLGMVIVVLGVAAAVLAWLADAPRVVRRLAGGVALLSVLQPVSSMVAKGGAPWVGSLHSIGAFVLFGLAGMLAVRARSRR
ncbi:MAG: hypothetical protein KF809_03245 [Chloroflexi bacterium]|nr:hypothetical protein [Chloroflexota bacterium]